MRAFLRGSVGVVAEREVPTEGIDTTTPQAGSPSTSSAAVAQIERELIRERTHAGLQAARARRRRGGRPAVVTPDKLAPAIAMRRQGDMTMKQIAKSLQVGRATLLGQRPKADLALLELGDRLHDVPERPARDPCVADECHQTVAVAIVSEPADAALG